MNTRMMRAAGLAAAAAMVSLAGAASAEEQTWKVGNNQYVIRLHDVDLGAAAGRRALYDRVHFAAAQLCRTAPRRGACETGARAQAMAQSAPRVQRAFALATAEAEQTPTVLAANR